MVRSNAASFCFTGSPLASLWYTISGIPATGMLFVWLLVYKVLAKALENSIRPTESGLRRIYAFVRRFVGCDHIILFEKFLMPFKPGNVSAQPLVGDALGFFVVAISLKAFHYNKLQRRPAIRIRPLSWHGAWTELAERKRIGSRQAAFLLEPLKGLNEIFRLLFGNHTRPQRKVPRKRTNRTAASFRVVVVVIQTAGFIPHQLV